MFGYLTGDLAIRQAMLEDPCRQVGLCHCFHGSRQLRTSDLELCPSGALLRVEPQLQGAVGDTVQLWQVGKPRVRPSLPVSQVRVDSDDEVPPWDPLICGRDELDPVEELPFPQVGFDQLILPGDELRPQAHPPVILRFLTWFLRRCDEPREATIHSVEDRLEDVLRRVWVGRLDPLAPFEHFMVRPAPPDRDPGHRFPHIVAVQDAPLDKAGILVSSIQGGLVSQQFAYFAPNPLTRFEVITALEAADACYLNHFFHTCQVRRGHIEVLQSEHSAAIQHGTSIELEIELREPPADLPAVPFATVSMFWPPEEALVPMAPLVAAHIVA